MPRIIGNESGEKKILYNPYQAAVREALAARTPSGGRRWRTLSVFAGRRGGKTHVGGESTGTECKNPSSVIYVAAPTYGKLLDYVWPAVWEFIPRSWVEDWNEQRQEMRLINKTIVRGRSMDDTDWLRGAGPDFVWMDEIRETTKAAYDAAMPALSDRKGAALITTTPNGFDWVYHEFWKKAVDGEPGYFATRYKTSDNPAIDPKEIEAKKRQYATNMAFYRQEFEADFVTFTGAVYGELVTPQILEHDEDIKKVIPEWPRINPSRPCLAAIDPGSDHPFGMVLGVSTEAGIVWIGEYLERNKPTIEHVRGLEPILRRDNPASPWEPSPWAIDRSAKQMSIELWQHGIRCAAAENDVMAGIQRVSSWLATKRMWFIRSRVPKLIDQMLSYRWAENTRPDGSSKMEKVIKVGDDLCDPVRYAMMSWPELPVPEISEHLGRRLIDFPEDRRWEMDRLNKCAARERGEEVPDDEMTGMLEPSDDDGPLSNFW